jgi:hypothetical protein
MASFCAPVYTMRRLSRCGFLPSWLILHICALTQRGHFANARRVFPHPLSLPPAPDPRFLANHTALRRFSWVNRSSAHIGRHNCLRQILLRSGSPGIPICPPPPGCGPFRRRGPVVATSEAERESHDYESRPRRRGRQGQRKRRSSQNGPQCVLLPY